jgi:hypothetical protein
MTNTYLYNTWKEISNGAKLNSTLTNSWLNRQKVLALRLTKKQLKMNRYGKRGVVRRFLIKGKEGIVPFIFDNYYYLDEEKWTLLVAFESLGVTVSQFKRLVNKVVV